jgi:small subunit ribosomal protein S1
MSQEPVAVSPELKTDIKVESSEAVSRPDGVVDTGRRVDVSAVRPEGAKTLRRHHRGRPGGGDKNKQRGFKPADPVKHELRGNGAIDVKSKNDVKGAYVKKLDASVEPAAKGMVSLRPELKVWDDTGDFAAMLDEEAPIKRLDVEVGSRVRARLIYMSKDTGFFALGPKHEGVMPMAELRDDAGNSTVKIGDTVDAYVVNINETIHLSKKVGRFAADLGMIEEAKAKKIPIEGKIISINTGGAQVSLVGVKAFCPMGQMDLNFVENPTSLIGKTFSFLVTQVAGGRNILLSRRAFLERERAEKARERLQTLKVGDRVTGSVARTADFGAFVDLSGIEGLIPASELGFGHGVKVEDRVKVGDVVTVDVMRIEADPKRQGQMRISLSLKAALPDPFETYGQYLVAGTSLEGKVARLEAFGAFVSLFDGIDGMIHISELSEQRVRHPSEVLKIGDPITVRILNVDFDKRRISLSLRENVERAGQIGGASMLKRGDKVEGVVERVERYGVFVKLGSGHTALLPASESGYPHGIDLGKPFSIGTSVPLMVIDIDDRSRVRVSKIAREKAEEQALVKSFTAKTGSHRGFGTLGDLFRAKI